MATASRSMRSRSRDVECDRVNPDGRYEHEDYIEEWVKIQSRPAAWS